MGRARKRKQVREDPAPSPEVKGGRRLPRAPGVPAASIGCVLLIAVVVAATYANSFAIPFLFDDHFAILGNPEVRSLSPFDRFFAQSRGLPHLLDVLNYRWGGESVWGYHFVNVAIHFVNATLVYVLALLTLRLPIHAGRYRSRAPVLALLIALIFAVHPLQTMAVSYIVQRAESLATMFYLLAVIVFAAGQSGRIPLRGRALGAVLLVIGFFGILSKETVASLPLALILYHVCFLRGRDDHQPGGSWRIALLLLLPVLYGVFLARHFLLPGFGDEGAQSSWMYIPSAGLGIDGITPWRYCITQFGVIVWYLRLLAFPTHLTFDYGWPFAETFWSIGVLLPLAVLVALLVTAVLSYSRNRWVSFAIGWLFITLAPSSSIIPIKDAAFEYRMYLPMIGLIMLAVVGAADAIGALAASREAARSGERAGLVAAVLCILALAVGTAVRNQTLQEPMLLAADSALKAPNHWRNQFSLGAALLENGRATEAIGPFERAIQLNPEQPTARIMLGDLYARAGRLEDAEDVLLPAIDAREESVSAAAYRQLGFLYKAQSYSDAAIGMFEEALARKPKWSSLDLEIVRLLRHDGRYHDAAVRLNRLVRAQPTYAGRLRNEIADVNLRGGIQSFEQGEPEFAMHMLSVAMGDPKTLLMATHYLAFVHSRGGDDAEAIRLLEDLERRGLANTAARENLARARAGEELQVPITLDRL